MKNSILLIFSLFLTLTVSGQNSGSLSGEIKDKNTQGLIAGANIIAIGPDTVRATSDDFGKFNLQLPYGTYRLVVNALGYLQETLYTIPVSGGNTASLQIELQAESQRLQEVVIGVRKTARAADMTTPLATQKLTSEEISVNPGGNFDVSKVIQVLPGVAGGTTANRNDIIVRGGGPSENVYYLDGIEIPVLNHFQTQGASGGATGIINVDFIDDIQLSSSAFDSKYDNALASTFVIKQRNGYSERLAGNFRLSGSEVAGMLEGPIGEKTTFMASVRRSYLTFLFQLLDLPIRPDYWDFQYKINHRINPKTELNLIGIGAIDDFRLESPKNSTPENEYILRSNPLIKQWNYTTGASLKRLIDNGYFSLALSRNMLSNGAKRYENNAKREGDILFNSESHEIENKLRFDYNKYVNGWKYSFGAGAQYVKYDTDIFNTLTNLQEVQNRSEIDFFKMGFYGHLSKYFLEDTWLLSAGFRSDFNTYTENGMNPLKTLSPRISLSYAINSAWNVSASWGTYYKLPSYTSLGFADPSGTLVNKNLDYINSIHYTVGTQWIPRNDFRMTVEGFYKDYNQYPVSLTDGISLANIGTDFSAIGNDSYASKGKGKVIGVDAYIQQKLINRLFYVLSGTVYSSEFSGVDGKLISSTWDYGYVFSTTLGYKFKKNWDVGVKYRIAGGQPYTPFDLDRSQASYLLTGRGVYDYNRLNSERLPLFQQLDLRVDKKINFKNSSLALFVDLQNAFLYKTPGLPKYTFERNAENTGFLTTDNLPIAQDGSNAIPVILDDRSATVVPAIGFIYRW